MFDPRANPISRFAVRLGGAPLMQAFDETRKGAATKAPALRKRLHASAPDGTTRVLAEVISIRANLNPLSIMKINSTSADVVTLILKGDKITLTAILKKATLLKATAAIREHGPANAAVTLQGVLAGSTVTAAGIAVYPKKKRGGGS
jgi:hypothetical protein